MLFQDILNFSFMKLLYLHSIKSKFNKITTTEQIALLFRLSYIFTETTSKCAPSAFTPNTSCATRLNFMHASRFDFTRTAQQVIHNTAGFFLFNQLNIVYNIRLVYKSKITSLNNNIQLKLYLY